MYFPNVTFTVLLCLVEFQHDILHQRRIRLGVLCLMQAALDADCGSGWDSDHRGFCCISPLSRLRETRWDSNVTEQDPNPGMVLVHPSWARRWQGPAGIAHIEGSGFYAQEYRGFVDEMSSENCHCVLFRHASKSRDIRYQARGATFRDSALNVIAWLVWLAAVGRVQTLRSDSRAHDAVASPTSRRSTAPTTNCAPRFRVQKRTLNDH